MGYNIFISVIAAVLLIFFAIGAYKDAKKTMSDLRRSREKRHGKAHS